MFFGDTNWAPRPVQQPHLNFHPGPVATYPTALLLPPDYHNDYNLQHEHDGPHSTIRVSTYLSIASIERMQNNFSHQWELQAVCFVAHTLDLLQRLHCIYLEATVHVLHQNGRSVIERKNRGIHRKQQSAWKAMDRFL